MDKLKGKWSMKHSQCQMCGTTEIPHDRYGFCKKCWPKIRYDVDHEKMKKYLRDSYYRRKYGQTEEEYKQQSGGEHKD